MRMLDQSESLGYFHDHRRDQSQSQRGRIQMQRKRSHLKQDAGRCKYDERDQGKTGVRQLKIHKSSKSGLVAAFFVSSP